MASLDIVAARQAAFNSQSVGCSVARRPAGPLKRVSILLLACNPLGTFKLTVPRSLMSVVASDPFAFFHRYPSAHSRAQCLRMVESAGHNNDISAHRRSCTWSKLSTSTGKRAQFLRCCAALGASAISQSVALADEPSVGTIPSFSKARQIFSMVEFPSGGLAERLKTEELRYPLLTLPSFGEPLLPAWLAGEWDLEQTLTSFSTPLGVEYTGATGRPVSEAEASAAETRAQIGKPVRLRVRYISSGNGCREDQAFNAQQRINAFAGREVVKRVRTCEEEGLDSGGFLSCVYAQFNGPVGQKIFVNSLRVETPERDAVVSSEVQRLALARIQMPGDGRRFPPITTDQEVVTFIRRDRSPERSTDGQEMLTGVLRLVSYLQPLDALFFSAAGKAVSISDYAITLKRPVNTAA